MFTVNHPEFQTDDTFNELMEDAEVLFDLDLLGETCPDDDQDLWVDSL